MFTTAGDRAGRKRVYGIELILPEVVTSGSQASVTFSSIPATYRDLIIRIRGRGDTAASAVDITMQINGDTGANYTRQYLNASITSVSAASSFGNNQLFVTQLPAANATANYSGAGEAIIYDYRGTTFLKLTAVATFASFASPTPGQSVTLEHGLWNSTLAINSLKIFPAAGNFVNNSVVSLYGSY